MDKIEDIIYINNIVMKLFKDKLTSLTNEIAEEIASQMKKRKMELWTESINEKSVTIIKKTKESIVLFNVIDNNFTNSFSLDLAFELMRIRKNDE